MKRNYLVIEIISAIIPYPRHEREKGILHHGPMEPLIKSRLECGYDCRF